MTVENKLDELIEVLEKSLKKEDDLDAKIRAKLKAKMDERGFGEADATRHVIDRDRGDAMPKPPKQPKPLLQSEGNESGPLWEQHHDKKNKEDRRHVGVVMAAPVVAKDEGINPSEQKYHIHVDGYRITKEPMTLAHIHATQGKNLEKDPSIKIVPHNPLKKEEGEMCKFDANGQWKIEKSNYGPKGYGLYNQNDNAQRKAKNTGDTVPDAGKNVNVKSYTTTSSSMGAAAADAEAKRQAAANKKAPVKTLADMTEEEKASIGKPKKPKLY